LLELVLDLGVTLQAGPQVELLGSRFLLLFLFLFLSWCRGYLS